MPPAPKYAIRHQPYHAKEPLVSQSAHPRCGALVQIKRLDNPNCSYPISMVPRIINSDNFSLLSAGNKIQYSKESTKYKCSKSPVVAAYLQKRRKSNYFPGSIVRSLANYLYCPNHSQIRNTLTSHRGCLLNASLFLQAITFALSQTGLHVASRSAFTGGCPSGFLVRAYV